MQIALDAQARQLDLAILDSDSLTLEQAKRIRADLASLPPVSDIQHAIDTAERFAFLDFVQTASLGKFDDDASDSGGFVFRTRINWNIPCKMGNDLYDNLVTAMGVQGFEARQAALDAVEKDLIWMMVRKFQAKYIAKAILTINGRSKYIGDTLVALLFPVFKALSRSVDYWQCKIELTRVAAELAIYRIEHNEYPETLADLGADVFNALPKDYYSGKPLMYQRKEGGKGYLLYSVGPNLETTVVVLCGMK